MLNVSILVAQALAQTVSRFLASSALFNGDQLSGFYVKLLVLLYDPFMVVVFAHDIATCRFLFLKRQYVGHAKTR